MPFQLTSIEMCSVQEKIFLPGLDDPRCCNVFTWNQICTKQFRYNKKVIIYYRKQMICSLAIYHCYRLLLSIYLPSLLKSQVNILVVLYTHEAKCDSSLQYGTD